MTVALKLRGGDAHSQGDPRLREQGKAQIVRDLFLLLCGNAARKRAEVLARRANEHINNAHEHHPNVLEHGKLQSGAAHHEEEHIEGRSPAVGALHKVEGQRAGVAEHRSQHHAHEQGAERDMQPANGEFQRGKRHGEEHEAYGHGHTVAVGEEFFLKQSENIAEHCSHKQGKQDFEERLHHNGHNIQSAAVHGLCRAEAHGENNQSHRVVKGDYGQQKARKLAFRLVLANDHKGCRRSGGGGDGAEGDCRRQRELFRHGEVERHQSGVRQQRRRKSLNSSHHGGCFTGLFEVGKAKFVANGEGYEAQRHI